MARDQYLVNVDQELKGLRLIQKEFNMSSLDKNTETTAKEVRGVPFKKGNDPRRNLAGRPPVELSMTTAVKEILNEIDPETKVERYKKLLLVAIEKAEKGDNDMIKYLVNRIDGLPRGSEQTTNVNVVIPLLGGDSHGISSHNSDREVIETQIED